MVLALTWPKQLNHNIPNQGNNNNSPISKQNNGNYAQSQNTETQPTNWKPTVAQNEIEHHSPQNVGEINSNPIRGLKPRPAKRGETTAPTKQSARLTAWEKRPKQPVREENLHPTAKCMGKTYPIFCVRIPAVEALREEKATPIFPVDEQNITKDANYSAWVLQQLVEPQKMSA